MINLTSNMTTEQIIIIIHKSITTPALVIHFVWIALVFLIVGLWSVKKDRGKFMSIWIISILFALVGTIMLITMPNITEIIISWFR